MKSWIAAFLLTSLSGNIFAVITTDVDIKGQLTGFNGIEFGGNTYDVDFSKESAIDLWFNGFSYDFLFANDSSGAYLAAQALSDTYDLFPEYDFNVSLTKGITINNGSAKILTPYFINPNAIILGMSTVSFVNGRYNNDDWIVTTSTSYKYPLSTPDIVYADWKYASVSEPPVYILMLFGFVGLFVSIRKREAKES